MHTVHTRAPAASLRGRDRASRSQIPARAAAGAAPFVDGTNNPHFLAPTNYTGSARASRGRVGSFKILLSLYSDESTDAKILSTPPVPVLFQSLGYRLSAKRRRRPTGRSAGVGRSVSGHTWHCTRTRPATCVLACEAVIRSRLSHLPLCDIWIGDSKYLASHRLRLSVTLRVSLTKPLSLRLKRLLGSLRVHACV
jgi:hypothetical protein